MPTFAGVSFDCTVPVDVSISSKYTISTDENAKVSPGYIQDHVGRSTSGANCFSLVAGSETESI